MFPGRAFSQLAVLAVLLLLPPSHGEHAPPPALYELDDWSTCSERYCMVRVILTSDGVQNRGALFLRDDLRLFRRTLLDRGVCLPALNRREPDARISLPAGAWNRSDRYILDRAFFPPDFHADESMQQAASGVINRRLKTQHPGLSAYTEVEYCLEHEHSTMQYEYAVASLLAVALILLCVLCFNARSWIFQEWRSSPASESRKQFLLFDLYKCFGMVGVVFAHCLLFGPFLLPMKNIDVLERLIANPDVKFHRLLFPFVMLVFFTMSSMLLTVKLLHDRLRNAHAPRPTFGAIVLHRLIRLQPLNLLTIGFCALAYDRFIGGPLGPRQLIVEQGWCRGRWWMNVLFISNFSMHKPCLPHSWYISADFQLFLLITLILLATFRWPQKTTAILSAAIGCSFLGPFLTVLWTNFNPIGPENLHEMRFFLLDSAYLAQLYTPFYNNLCWSVGGMLAGLVYDRVQQSADDKSRTIARRRTIVVRCVNAFAAVSFLLLLAFVHLTVKASESSPPCERWWLAVCYAAFKISAAAFCSAIILRVLLTEQEFFGAVIAKMGARLYYCVYLIHFPVFRIVFSSATAATDVTPELLLRMSLKVFAISYGLAVLLHHTFEKPVMGFLRRILLSRV